MISFLAASCGRCRRMLLSGSLIEFGPRKGAAHSLQGSLRDLAHSSRPTAVRRLGRLPFVSSGKIGTRRRAATCIPERFLPFSTLSQRALSIDAPKGVRKVPTPPISPPRRSLGDAAVIDRKILSLILDSRENHSATLLAPVLTSVSRRASTCLIVERRRTPFPK